MIPACAMKPGIDRALTGTGIASSMNAAACNQTRRWYKSKVDVTSAAGASLIGKTKDKKMSRLLLVMYAGCFLCFMAGVARATTYDLTLSDTLYGPEDGSGVLTVNGPVTTGAFTSGRRRADLLKHYH